MFIRKLVLTAASLCLALPAMANNSATDVETQQSMAKDEKTMETQQSKAGKTKESEQARAPMQIDSVNKVLDNPAAFASRTVSLNGEVEEVNGAQSFVVDGPGWWNDEIMVITRKPLSSQPNKVADGAKVVVTGQIVTNTIIEIEREYGWDFESQIEAEIEDTQTFILADSVTITEED